MYKSPKKGVNFRFLKVFAGYILNQSVLRISSIYHLLYSVARVFSVSYLAVDQATSTAMRAGYFETAHLFLIVFFRVHGT